jgi:hypothetical protein
MKFETKSTTHTSTELRRSMQKREEIWLQTWIYTSGSIQMVIIRGYSKISESIIGKNRPDIFYG